MPSTVPVPVAVQDTYPQRQRADAAVAVLAIGAVVGLLLVSAFSTDWGRGRPGQRVYLGRYLLRRREDEEGVVRGYDTGYGGVRDYVTLLTPGTRPGSWYVRSSDGTAEGYVFLPAR